MTTTFKFHYKSREQLLEDYLEYMPKKNHRHSILDIKDVRHTQLTKACASFQMP